MRIAIDKTATRVYYKNMDKYPLEYRKNSGFLLLFPMRRDITSLCSSGYVLINYLVRFTALFYYRIKN
jgi:hypothetical protein